MTLDRTFLLLVLNKTLFKISFDAFWVRGVEHGVVHKAEGL